MHDKAAKAEFFKRKAETRHDKLPSQRLMALPHLHPLQQQEQPCTIKVKPTATEIQRGKGVSKALSPPVTSGNMANLVDNPGREATKMSISNSSVGHTETRMMVNEVKSHANPAKPLMILSDTFPAGITRHKISDKVVKRTPPMSRDMATWSTE